MERTRSLSPLESGGWPFGTERSSSHPTLDSNGAPLSDLFAIRLEEADPTKRRATEPGRSREVDIRNDDPAARAEKRSEAPEHKRPSTDKGTRDSDDSSNTGRERQVSNNEQSEQPTEVNSSAAELAPTDQPATNADGGALLDQPPAGFENVAEQVAETAEGALPSLASAVNQANAGAVPAQVGAASRGVAGPAAPQAPPVDGATAAGAVEKAEKSALAKGAAKSAESQQPARPEVDMERTSAIFKQLRMQLTPSTRHATINLVPADLGRIVIHLTVRGGKVTGDIQADKAETLKILEAHAPELRSALEHLGFDSTDLNLSRHGDPSSDRSSESTFPLSETIGREPSTVPKVAPNESLSILRKDKIDTLA
ncbi:MAG: flagellar hook-length control protein FliK [Planctomycetota bacterium]|jgi:flagellar hook-length control protein FliK